ncbi:MAG: multicopper oxidase domain-containing protein [Chloroflexi bacterium]|nr:multicopper oxidase domain-containing protein [Chloroflexota bacterium]
MKIVGLLLTPGRRLVFTVAAVAALLAFTGVAILLWGGGSHKTKAQTVREYALEVRPADLDYGDGAVWHAWTFNGTVPGPTLKVKVGETLRVKVTNNLGMVASFHAHMEGYSLRNDGSQANLLAQEGESGLLAPGAQYTYEFTPPSAGLFYYHTHSADKGIAPSKFVMQGLYGAIIVADPKETPLREEVLFLGERGHDREGNLTHWVMNGMGLPGGEVALENIFKEQGMAGIEKQFNRTLPTFKMKVNERIKLHVINIGDMNHSLYIHSAEYVSLGVLGGRPWPAKVVPLVPGAADTLLLRFTNPGLWLFHCHVESHADTGMVGLFIAE